MAEQQRRYNTYLGSRKWYKKDISSKNDDMEETAKAEQATKTEQMAMIEETVKVEGQTKIEETIKAVVNLETSSSMELTSSKNEGIPGQGQKDSKGRAESKKGKTAKWQKKAAKSREVASDKKPDLDDEKLPDDPEAAFDSDEEGGTQNSSKRKRPLSTHFLGVPLPDVYRTMAADLVGSFETELSKSLRLVATDKMHVTLHFLGEITAEQLTALQMGLEKEIVQDQFDMQLKGGGCFPSARRPRVLWIGCREQDNAHFQALLQQILKALTAANLPAKLDDDFHPHITVGRARKHKVPGVKETIQHQFETLEWPVVLVDRITLWRSDHQRHTSPIYTVVQEFFLRNPALPPPDAKVILPPPLIKEDVTVPVVEKPTEETSEPPPIVVLPAPSSTAATAAENHVTDLSRAGPVGALLKVFGNVFPPTWKSGAWLGLIGMCLGMAAHRIFMGRHPTGRWPHR